MKGFIGINVPKGMEVLYNIFAKPLMSEKMKKRIYLTAEENWSDDTFKELKHILPKEYGGDNSSVKDISEIWTNKIINNKDMFSEDLNYYCDENLRPERSRRYSEQLGIGAFRQLNID